MDVASKAQAYKVKLVALVAARAQFRANREHTIAELEINQCTEDAKLAELKETLAIKEEWNEKIRSAVFEDDAVVDPELLDHF